MKLLIVRPQPGASETAARARKLGLDPVVSPLFEIRPLRWQAPDPEGFDALLLTSANAVRHGGGGLARFVRLPCYAVGEASAEAAREAGFGDVRTGPGDAAAAAAMMEKDGVRRAFHPCGRDRAGLGEPGIDIVHVPVYAADPIDELPADAKAALDAGPLVLVHSPRSGALLARLVPNKAGVAVAAISAAAAQAAGGGWRSVAVASAPSDEALLELAAKLCQTEGHGPRS
ncbi:MAG TPA: uroporphyrinogen-III synthase [Allosphingosinicella sp.]